LAWTGIKIELVSLSSQPLMLFEGNFAISDNLFHIKKYAQAIFIFPVG
jgi:hypothetical protein